MLIEPSCYKRNCKWFGGVKQGKDESTEVVVCPAFPDGIPRKIIRGKNLHKSIFPGQVGTTIYEKGPKRVKVVEKEEPPDKGSREFQELYDSYAEEVLGEPLCMSCKHSNHNGTCKAFPVAIPIDIVAGVVNHFLPHDGDNDIQYEQDPELPQMLEA